MAVDSDLGPGEPSAAAFRPRSARRGLRLRVRLRHKWPRRAGALAIDRQGRGQTPRGGGEKKKTAVGPRLKDVRGVEHGGVRGPRTRWAGSLPEGGASAIGWRRAHPGQTRRVIRQATAHRSFSRRWRAIQGDSDARPALEVIGRPGSRLAKNGGRAVGRSQTRLSDWADPPRSPTRGSMR